MIDILSQAIIQSVGYVNGIKIHLENKNKFLIIVITFHVF